MTAISINTTAAPRETGRAIWISMLLAGLAGALNMYATWRFNLEVPLQLTVPLHMDPATESVRPWAPWWVPVAITALLAMLLWRAFAVRADGVRFVGGTVAATLTCYLTFVVAVFCLEYGAILQYVPPPPLAKLLMVSPLVLIGSVKMLALQLFFGFPVATIGNLLIAMAITATARLTWRFTA
jgi:hypothetical protein